MELRLGIDMNFNLNINVIFIRFVVVFVLVLFLASIVNAGVDKPKKICYYTPRYIKCTDWTECINGRWERICHDIRKCINDGDEFRVVGRCSSDYAPREEPKTPEQIEDEKEKEIREMFKESFDADVEEEIDGNVIRLEEIVGNGKNSGYEIEGLDDTVLLEDGNNLEDGGDVVVGNGNGIFAINGKIVYSAIGLLIVLLILGIIYYSFFRKKDSDNNTKKSIKLGDFRKEIKK